MEAARIEMPALKSLSFRNMSSIRVPSVYRCQNCPEVLNNSSHILSFSTNVRTLMSLIAIAEYGICAYGYSLGDSAFTGNLS